MKAKTQYNDFLGTVAADISDGLSRNGDDLNSIAKHFELDTDRFKIVGLSVYGTENFRVSLICVDNEKSTAEKEHIVKISLEIADEREILDVIFKRLNIVLHNQFEREYLEKDYDEEASFSDFHNDQEQ
ncbi:hypothetical protein DET49_13017 [Salegentibacter sp. 24]|uniref:hypothetical protein n=1 Tax=Salegentibacter sp. 24 TaxID=2183986 RepID=UPI0010611238|nr:hypothetical protein [Salegentibacter sp. 24]TDN80805.1 hypothetical protein DET49_13017 [Salegentibacter sp. 24]